MKVLLTTAAVAAVLITAFLVMGASNPRQSRDYSITLQARISSLERRVENLEKRLQVNTGRRSPPAVRPAIPRPEQRPPRGLRRKEFNGATYYLIPLEQ